MGWVIVGLGNPGPEYHDTRHNTGRMVLEFFAKRSGFNDWREDKKKKATMTGGMIGKTAALLVCPDTFMNKSGSAVDKFVKSAKAASHMVVVYDDLDLPVGRMKLSFDRGSGGHKGLESVMRAVKTKKFARIRVGVSPATAAGAIRKPSGDKEVNAFILAKFRESERDELKKVFRKTCEAIEAIVLEGPHAAMNRFNQ